MASLDWIASGIADYGYMALFAAAALALACAAVGIALRRHFTPGLSQA